MRFEFATATRILFGAGVSKEVPSAAKAFGRRAFVVIGKTRERAEPLLESVSAAGLCVATFGVGREPGTDLVRHGVQQAKAETCDVVIAMGGGSVIDAGKAIAALITNAGELADYLEIVGRGKPLELPPAPFIAIPTTAGSGAEVTRNAVLASPEHRVKVSLRSAFMLPKLAVVDPELALGLPAALTASTGLDALTQLIEPFVSCRANPLTDALCRDGIPRVARSLRRACDEPRNLAAREDMALASLCSGLALANAALGVVHGFAAPIGGMFAAPHGAVCAALLPHAMQANVRALRQREPNHEALPRYAEIARLLTGHVAASADDGAAWVGKLCAALKIPPLRTYGLRETDGPTLCEKAAISSSMKGNPLRLTDQELRDVLMRAL